MVSQEHKNAANFVPEDRILDAAYELLLAIGMRRMTMADIARAAEVSRPTLYRRWTGVRAVIAALMTREWSRLAVAALGSETTGRDRMVGTVTRMAAAVRTHPMMRKILELDPDFLLPYVLQRRGTSTTQQLEVITTGLRAGQADGSIRAGDVDTLARGVLLTTMSFVLTGPVLLGEGDPAELDVQLSDIIDRYLRP